MPVLDHRVPHSSPLCFGARWEQAFLCSFKWLADGSHRSCPGCRYSHLCRHFWAGERGHLCPQAPEGAGEGAAGHPLSLNCRDSNSSSLGICHSQFPCYVALANTRTRHFLGHHLLGPEVSGVTCWRPTLNTASLPLRRLGSCSCHHRKAQSSHSGIHRAAGTSHGFVYFVYIHSPYPNPLTLSPFCR